MPNTPFDIIMQHILELGSYRTPPKAMTLFNVTKVFILYNFNHLDSIEIVNHKIQFDTLN